MYLGVHVFRWCLQKFLEINYIFFSHNLFLGTMFANIVFASTSVKISSF